MRFPRVEFHTYAVARKIDVDVENARDLYQQRPQFPNACIAIFAFGCDVDCLDNRVIGSFGIKRIARLSFVWSRRVHPLLNARRRVVGCNLSRYRFQDAPDILRKNLLAGFVWMNVIGLI